MRQERAVADVRAVPVLTEDEARHRVGGAARPARGDGDDDVGELQLEDDAHDDGRERHRQHQREDDLAERLPGRRAVDARGLDDLGRQRLEAGQEHDHHERDEDPGVEDRHRDRRASSGLAKKAGSSQPSARASFDTGPKRNSSIDLPIIQHTATGDSISGSRNATRKNRRARIWALSSSARPKAMAYSTNTPACTTPCCGARSSRTGRSASARCCPGRRTSGRSNDERFQSVKAMADAEQQRDDRQRDDEERGGQHEQDALALLAPDEHLAHAQADAPDDPGDERSAASSRSRGPRMPTL